jgi:Retrotransposon gag protein/Zinc knuckle
MKTKNPDAWSGTRATLPRFLAACRAKFMLEAHNFSSEIRKIGFAGSYLDGAPADWWFTLFQRYEEAQVKGIEPPLEFTSFAVFAQSLTTTYGDPDLKGTMEHDLCALRQTGSVANYAAEFQRIGNYLSPGWGDEPLLFHFRLHLKDNIKNALVHEKPYPQTLLEMVAAAIRLDNRESEKIRDRKTMAGYSSTQSSRPRQAAGTQQLTAAPSSQPRSTPQTTPTVQISPPVTSNDGTTPMELDYVEKKRITEAERDRRRTLKLCMYCAEPGHFRRDCPAIPRRAINLILQTPHTVNFITEINEPSDTSATNANAQG